MKNGLFQKLLNINDSLESLRGKWFEYRGISLIATYHPEDLLKDTSLKRTAWEDLQIVMEALKE